MIAIVVMKNGKEIAFNMIRMQMVMIVAIECR